MAQTPAIQFDPNNVYEYVNEVAANNVHSVMDEIPRRSEILDKLLNEGKIAIIGGMYDIETGIVNFYEHPHLEHFELERPLVSSMFG